MSTIYFPGCQYTALSPENSAKMQGWLRGRGVAVAGCCRRDFARLTEGDTAVCVCPTCLALLRAAAPGARVVTLWQLLAGDEAFPWPDYGGRPLTLQHCADTAGSPEIQTAVHTLLCRMNLQPVQLPAAARQFPFCRPRTAAQTAAVKRHCATYTTEAAACYCTGCLKALRAAGVQGFHLLDLLVGHL